MKADLRRKKILIVDDMPANIKILGQALRIDYTMMVATSGEKALQIARSPEPPDLILLDIMMPIMDGYEVCRILKADERTQNIPVIFVTAKDEEADETHGLALGAIDYITKPFSIPIVFARVKNHLALKEAKEKIDRAYARIEDEINLVANLQRSLLPKDDYRVSGYGVEALYKPSGKASGDYFDYFYVNTETLRILVADVSGHGPRAAFLMGIVRTLFRLTETEYLPLPETLQRINLCLMQVTGHAGDFVTLFSADLNMSSGELRYVNAGHCPGILSNAQQITLIESSTIPLGIMTNAFEEKTIQVDMIQLFLFTDGFYEWLLADGTMFGLDRFTNFIEQRLKKDKLVVSELEERLLEHVESAPVFNDDLTALYIVNNEGKK